MRLFDRAQTIIFHALDRPGPGLGLGIMLELGLGLGLLRLNEPESQLRNPELSLGSGKFSLQFLGSWTVIVVGIVGAVRNVSTEWITA